MDGNYRHILVALDGSPGARSALRHAIGLARLTRARVTLQPRPVLIVQAEPPEEDADGPPEGEEAPPAQRPES